MSLYTAAKLKKTLNSRVERPRDYLSAPPHQTVRAVFPHTAFPAIFF
jgi:hypothetical protein